MLPVKYLESIQKIQYFTSQVVQSRVAVFSECYLDKEIQANILTECCFNIALTKYSICSQTSTSVKERGWEEGTDLGEMKAAYSLTTHMLKTFCHILCNAINTAF